MITLLVAFMACVLGFFMGVVLTNLKWADKIDEMYHAE